MSDETRVLEEAKSEALAAFAAIASVIDLADGAGTAQQSLAADSLRADAVRHLSAALEMMGRAKGFSG